MESGQLKMDIVPTHLAVKAMRDNGYRNAAYALAELMDNSIQAGASSVELLCGDKEEFVEDRTRRRLSEVAVLDNGCGMDETVLRVALQFGNGSRLEDGKRGGMGRFGMGLPSASISQCQRVDVWSWQDGPDSALHSYIDLEEIEDGDLREVPEPEPKEIPAAWMKAGRTFGQTGTLVVWSRIDRALWRTSAALINNSEQLIGRMYRDWLNDATVTIRLASFLRDRPEVAIEDRDALPNDPLYLMERTSSPKPFDEKAMFRPFPSPEAFEIRPRIRFKGEDHEVVLRFSMAIEEARQSGDGGQTAGNMPHGRHAAHNTGVSVVRAGRELHLDTAWINTYDPRERWWGVEVRFEPPLDDLFGVSNNKQSARHFTEAAALDPDALAKEHGSVAAAQAALRDDEDPLAPLLELVFQIRRQIRQMRKAIESQAEGTRRSQRRHETPEQAATDVVRKLQKKGHRGRSDDDEKRDPDERKAELSELLIDEGRSEDEAEELAASTIDSGLKYQVSTAALDNGAFFSVQPRGGVLVVTLNLDHPAYSRLLGAKTPDELPDEVAELKKRLRAAQEGLEMMLFAWARFEDEQIDDEERRAAQRARFDWGIMAEHFLATRSQDGQ
jgi:hypothetical protein